MQPMETLALVLILLGVPAFLLALYFVGRAYTRDGTIDAWLKMEERKRNGKR